MLKKYVDNVNVILDALGVRVRWSGEKIEWREELQEKDKKSKIPTYQRTMKGIL